ncbi:MAG TPA: membrane protein insertion efficiency factor YidD [bacterium]|nr:membrane protein insertion efficiency factor YidD [bacterium]HQP96964.1 membrane protein insertion efficiency factor YidD [bacterium]
MRAIVLMCLRVYRQVVSPCLPPLCRFHPTCSVYAHEVIEHFGLRRGLRLAFARILRCHPWHPGGIDLPPER